MAHITAVAAAETVKVLALIFIRKAPQRTRIFTDRNLQQSFARFHSAIGSNKPHSLFLATKSALSDNKLCRC